MKTSSFSSGSFFNSSGVNFASSPASPRGRRFNSLIAASSCARNFHQSFPGMQRVCFRRIATFHPSTRFSTPSGGGKAKGEMGGKKAALSQSCVAHEKERGGGGGGAIDSALENNSGILYHPLSLSLSQILMVKYRKTHKSKLHLRAQPPMQKCSPRINIRALCSGFIRDVFFSHPFTDICKRVSDRVGQSGSR